MTNLDPADFNVITGAFKSVAAEMGDIMLRAAYSSIVREAKDCSTCVMDADAKTIPIMNSLAAAIPRARSTISRPSSRRKPMRIIRTRAPST